MHSLPLPHVMAGRKLQRTPSSDDKAAAMAAAAIAASAASANPVEAVDGGAGPVAFCHISQRYPHMTGRVLQDKVFEDWVIPKCEGITSPWYLTNGTVDRERALVRSTTNKARAMNMSSVEEYAKKCQTDGLLRGLGSELWAMPGDVIIQPGKTIFYLLTGGTRAEAVYRAHVDAPHAPSVVSTINGGSPNMVLFKQDTPDDVQEYLRDIGNSLNDFSVSSTWIESLTLIPTVTLLFEAEKKRREREGSDLWSMKALTDAAKNAKAKGLPPVDGYEATYWKFAEKLYPKRWLGPNSFKDCRFAVRKLGAINGTGELTAWAQEAVVWTDKRLSAGCVFGVLAESFKVFESTCPDLVSHAPLLARFAMPSNGDLACPYLIKDTPDMGMLGKCLMVLGDDRKMIKQAGYSATFSPDTPSSGHFGVKPSVRPTLLLDELLRVMNGCLACVNDSDINWRIYDKILLAGFCMAMKGSVTVYVNTKLRQRPSVVLVAEYIQNRQPPPPPAATTADKPEKEKKRKAQAPKRRKAGLGRGNAPTACTGTAAVTGGFDEEAGATLAAGAAHVKDGGDDEFGGDASESDMPEEEMPDGTRTVLKTPLQLLKFTHQLICKIHNVEKGEYEIIEDAEADVPVAGSAVEAPVVAGDEESSSNAALVAFLVDKDVNKHTRVSTALATFMRHHPVVKPHYMPVTHSTLSNSRAMLSQQLNTGGLTELIRLGDALSGEVMPFVCVRGVCRYGMCLDGMCLSGIVSLSQC